MTDTPVTEPYRVVFDGIRLTATDHPAGTRFLYGNKNSTLLQSACIGEWCQDGEFFCLDGGHIWYMPEHFPCVRKILSARPQVLPADPGRALRDWRKKNGVTANRLAASIGCRAATVITMAETGLRTPSYQTAVEVERITGIPAAAWNHARTAIQKDTPND